MTHDDLTRLYLSVIFKRLMSILQELNLLNVT